MEREEEGRWACQEEGSQQDRYCEVKVDDHSPMLGQELLEGKDPQTERSDPFHGL
jgi:hypothetical protein